MRKLTVFCLAIACLTLAISPRAMAKKGMSAIDRQQLHKAKAEERHLHQRNMIEDFCAAKEEKRAGQESRWNDMMRDFGQVNDQKERWLLF